MGWIKERIEAEKKKHPSLDWAQLAEAKIIRHIMEGFVWKNNTIPFSEMHDQFECECGHSLLEHNEADLENKTGEGCKSDYCFCPRYKKKERKSKLHLATTDGGWVNAMKLHNYLK